MHIEFDDGEGMETNIGDNDSVVESGIDKSNAKRYPRYDETGLEGKVISAEERLDKLLTTQEVCELLKISKGYLYWLTHQKKIPHIKMQGHLRFRKSAIDSWLREQEVRSGDTQERE